MDKSRKDSLLKRINKRIEVATERISCFKRSAAEARTGRSSVTMVGSIGVSTVYRPEDVIYCEEQAAKWERSLADWKEILSIVSKAKGGR